MAARPWEVTDDMWRTVAPLIPPPPPRADGRGRPRVEDRKVLSGILFRALHRHPLGSCPAGTWLWVRRHLLASPGRLARGRSVGQTPRSAACETEFHRRSRSLSRHRGRQPHSGEKGGEKTGKSPVDRGRIGSKYHILVDGSGLPMSFELTGGNRADVTQCLALVDGIPPIRGRVGAPRRKPTILLADRGYDSQSLRDELADRGIGAIIARRRTENGSGLGQLRWAIERTFAWLHRFKRLHTRYWRHSPSDAR